MLSIMLCIHDAQQCFCPLGLHVSAAIYPACRRVNIFQKLLRNLHSGCSLNRFPWHIEGILHNIFYIDWLINVCQLLSQVSSLIVCVEYHLQGKDAIYSCESFCILVDLLEQSYQSWPAVLKSRGHIFEWQTWGPMCPTTCFKARLWVANGPNTA